MSEFFLQSCYSWSFSRGHLSNSVLRSINAHIISNWVAPRATRKIKWDIETITSGALCAQDNLERHSLLIFLGMCPLDGKVCSREHCHLHRGACCSSTHLTYRNPNHEQHRVPQVTIMKHLCAQMGKMGSKEKVASINPAAVLVISYIQNAVIKTLGFSN